MDIKDVKKVTVAGGGVLGTCPLSECGRLRAVEDVDCRAQLFPRVAPAFRSA